MLTNLKKLFESINVLGIFFPVLQGKNKSQRTLNITEGLNVLFEL